MTRGEVILETEQKKNKKKQADHSTDRKLMKGKCVTS